jgi:hypothetical protein
MEYTDDSLHNYIEYVFTTSDSVRKLVIIQFLHEFLPFSITPLPGEFVPSSKLYRVLFAAFHGICDCG